MSDLREGWRGVRESMYVCERVKEREKESERDREQ